MSSTSALPNYVAARLREELGDLSSAEQDAALRLWTAEDGEALLDAERKTRATMRERADQLTTAILSAKLQAPDFVDPLCEEVREAGRAADQPMQSRGDTPISIRLLGGSRPSLRTRVMNRRTPKDPGQRKKRGKRGPKGSGTRPALAQLRIIGQSTPALRAEVAREIANSNSLAAAHQGLRERGVRLTDETALRLAYILGDRGLQWRTNLIDEAWVKISTDAPLPTGPLSGKRVVIGVDGGRVRLREPTGEVDPKTERELYEVPWREPKIITIYVVDDEGERDPSFDRFLDGTMEDADAVFRLLIGHLVSLGAHHARDVTFVSDGAEWIWNRADAVRQALRLPTERFHEVLDWYHANERVGEISKRPIGWSDERRKKWREAGLQALRTDRLDDLLRAIDDMGTSERLEDCAKDYGYFEGHAERVRYQYFKSAFIVRGSGSTESGVRQVVNLRMKGNSVYWLKEHAETMLLMRSYLKSGRWEELVRGAVRQPVWSPRRVE